MSKLVRQAVFIDRDGTLGGTDRVVLPGEFELYPKVKDSIQSLRAAGMLICSFTNQPGIARGEATMGEFESELSAFGFDKIYLCGHEHGADCECRKPSAGMLLKAAEDNHLDLAKCYVIGDRWTDMVAAKEAGCKKALVMTGAGAKELEKYNNHEFFGKWKDAYPDFIATDLNEAVTWILEGGVNK
ncbi:HAD-IIIA family hydrolase [Paenibacillus sp. CR_12]|uniref:HAD-IIIA family hydrolase n=1 Tax=Paenibacillus sp. CR_12 TaxID=3055793 RepID=UPI0035C1B0D2